MRSLRWFFAVSGAACLAVRFVPGAARPLLGATLAFARDPAAAIRALHVALVVMAAALVAAALFLPALVPVIAAAVRRVAGMAPRRYVLLLAVVALALRAAAGSLSVPPDITDSAWYHETASSLARGTGLAADGQLTAYRPPGYSWVLSLFYRLAGPHAELAWIPGLLATGLLLAATFRIASLIHGERVARLACLGLAGYPALVLATGLPASDLLFTAGLTALFAWNLGADPRRATTPVLTGVGLGLLALVRTAGVVFWGAFVLIAWVRTRNGRRAMADGLLMAVLMALPLAGWSLRNARVFGEPTLVTNGGINLLVGNHPGASGGYDVNLGGPQPELGSLNEAQVDRVLAGRALAFLRQHPIEAIGALPKKVFRLFAFELDVAQTFFTATRSPPWVKYATYGLCQAVYLVLLGLFLARCVAIWRSSSNERPIGLQWTGFWVGAAVVIVTLVTFGQDRYRMPFLPWMMIEGLRGRIRRETTSQSFEAPDTLDTFM